MNEPVPPLPNLKISLATAVTTSQATVDRVLQELYDRRPEFFAAIAHREKAKEGTQEENQIELRRLIREELKPLLCNEPNFGTLTLSTAIFWEARRRARLMYGMAI